MSAQRRDREIPISRGFDLASEPAQDTEIAFLEQIVWALDGLRRHTERRGHATLAVVLAHAAERARQDLRAAEPPAARVASGRMKALWRHEGRV